MATAPKIQDVLDEVSAAVVEASHGRALEDAATFAVQHIRQRTKRGISINKQRFVHYSKRYARRKKGGRRQPVTLTDTGKMLASVRKRRRSGDRITIRVDDDIEKARALHRLRPWFGLTNTARIEAERLWGSVINESVPRDIDKRFTIRVNF